MNKRPWINSYPSFVPEHADLEKYNTVLDVFDHAVERFQDKTAYVNMDVTLTFNEVDRYSDGFAWYLQNKTNLKPGDRIAIQMPNLLQFPIALFGAMKAGLVIVNTNPLYTAKEMKHQFNDAGVKGIVILENFACNLEQILDDTGVEEIIVTRIGDMLGGFKGFVVNNVVKYVKKMVPPFNLPQTTSFKSITKESKGKKPVRPEINADSVLFLQYTGGTTGLSKGATLTHSNITANVQQVYSWIGNLFDLGNEVIVTALPMYHIFALTVNCIVFLSCGSKNILVTNPRDMKSFMATLKKYPMTYFTGVNTLFNGMMNQEAFKEVDFSNLKVVIGGGMAVQESVALRWKEMTGTDLLEGYGLSETSPVVCVDPIDGSHIIGSIGLPVPDTDVVLYDEDYNEVPAGERGEIAVKGPQVMKGYWEKAEENEKCFKNGYFLTGDIGVMDEKGYFKIVDRKKEMVLVSGFNVFPSEVEHVISGHPGVLEVGVRGVPDEKSTEAVKAFVVKKDPNLTEEEIRNYCKEHLTNYKVPKHVVFREELPKSNVGKILRRLLE
jgi:long-chain acyl-CoA synthetase